MQFRPDIEGLRAVAVLLVVLFHAKLAFPGGYVGVDVFFVLSGYLITGILLKERTNTGRIDLPRFYARRARRLLPASLLMVVVTAVVASQILSPLEQNLLSRTVLAVALYSSNLLFAWYSGDYLAQLLDYDPWLHTWSLGVEEQFYLVWPVLLLLGARLGRVRSVLGALVGIGLVASVAVTWVDASLAFFLSPLRAWEFGVGALALVLQDRLGGLRGAGVGGVGLGAVVVAALLYTEELAFPGLWAVLPVGGTAVVLVAGATTPENPVSKALGSAVGREIGRLSYGWYLWHWPLLVLARHQVQRELGTVEAVVLLLVSLGIAKLSFHLWEQPLRHAALLEPRWRALVVGLAASALVAAFGFGWTQWAKALGRSPELAPFTEALTARHMPKRCHLDTKRSELQADRCHWGPEGAPHVVLHGDSHASQWFEVLRGAAERGEIRLTALTKSGCRPLPEPIWDATRKRPFTECATWVKRVQEALPELDPDVVVVQANSAPEVLPEQWVEGLPSLVEATRRADARLVFLQAMPRDVDMNFLCPPRQIVRGGDPAACRFAPGDDDGYGAAIDGLVGQRGVEIVELNDLICPRDDQGRCLLMREGVPIWRDPFHVSVPFVKSIGPTFLERLELGRAAGR